VIKKSKLQSNPELPKLMIQELNILKIARHQNIMEVKEILHDDENFYVSSEICEGGELFDKIIEMKKFGEIDAADIIN
jgi:calcium-dependent protein kinase